MFDRLRIGERGAAGKQRDRREQERKGAGSPLARGRRQRERSRRVRNPTWNHRVTLIGYRRRSCLIALENPAVGRVARDPVDPDGRNRRNPAPIWRKTVSEALK